MALALCVSSCCTSRKAVSSQEQVRLERVSEKVDSVQEHTAVAVHDTLQEVTTITIQTNDRGDTLKVTQITDRNRIRAMSDFRSKKEEVKVRIDTVYIERRDSTSVSSSWTSQATKSMTRFQVSGGEDKSTWGGSFRSTLKWIFAVICAIIGLIITVKVCYHR